jgi:hypothetical protein
MTHRKRKEKWDLGLQFHRGYIPGDQVLILGCWFLIVAVWKEHGEFVYDLARFLE